MSNRRPFVKHLDKVLIDRLCTQAGSSPRLRTAFNLHESPVDPVQRFINVMQPGTYVRPHRHDDPSKWELTVVLSGWVAILLLEEDGLVIERIELDALGSELGIEIPAGIWHTSAALSPDSVLLEIKPGPFVAKTDKTFAVWAPEEGNEGCVAFEKRIRTAQPGDLLAAQTLRSHQTN